MHFATFVPPKNLDLVFFYLDLYINNIYMAVCTAIPGPLSHISYTDLMVFATISAVTMYMNMQPFSMAGFVEEL